MDSAQRAERRRVFLSGVRDGVPIGLGYLAVAFSLGIAARNAGLNAFQGFLISLLNNASAGEYAAFTVIAADSGFLEMALITLITNARYLLMSCSLSQKFSPDTPLYHRLLVGYDVTDELFGIAIARPGYLDPFYSYGAFLPAIPGWAIGTALGVTAGSVLPARLGQRAFRRAVRHVFGNYYPTVEEEPGRARLRSGQFCSKLAVLRPAAYKGALRGNADDSSDRRNCIRSRAVLPCEGRTGAEGGTA